MRSDNKTSSGRRTFPPSLRLSFRAAKDACANCSPIFPGSPGVVEIVGGVTTDYVNSAFRRDPELALTGRNGCVIRQRGNGRAVRRVRMAYHHLLMVPQLNATRTTPANRELTVLSHDDAELIASRSLSEISGLSNCRKFVRESRFCLCRLRHIVKVDIENRTPGTGVTEPNASPSTSIKPYLDARSNGRPNMALW